MYIKFLSVCDGAEIRAFRALCPTLREKACLLVRILVEIFLQVRVIDIIIGFFLIFCRYAFETIVPETNTPYSDNIRFQFPWPFFVL